MGSLGAARVGEERRGEGGYAAWYLGGGDFRASGVMWLLCRVGLGHHPGRWAGQSIHIGIHLRSSFFFFLRKKGNYLFTPSFRFKI